MTLSGLGDRVVAQVHVRCRDEQARRIAQQLTALDGVAFVSDEALVRSER